MSSTVELNDLRSRPVAELDEVIVGMKEEIFNIRFQQATADQGVATSRIRTLRRDIARVKTIQREKALAEKE